MLSALSRGDEITVSFTLPLVRVVVVVWVLVVVVVDFFADGRCRSSVVVIVRHGMFDLFHRL
jgi:hypothetical protein